MTWVWVTSMPMNLKRETVLYRSGICQVSSMVSATAGWAGSRVIVPSALMRMPRSLATFASRPCASIAFSMMPRGESARHAVPAPHATMKTVAKCDRIEIAPSSLGLMTRFCRLLTRRNVEAHDRPRLRSAGDLDKAGLLERRYQSRPGEDGRHFVFSRLDWVALDGHPALFTNAVDGCSQ